MKKSTILLIGIPLVLLGLYIGIIQLTSSPPNRSILIINKNEFQISIRITYRPNYLPDWDVYAPIIDARPEILIPKGTSRYTYTPPDDVTRENRSRPIFVEIYNDKEWVKVNNKSDQNNPVLITLPDSTIIKCWIETITVTKSEYEILATKYVSVVHME